MPCFEKKNGKEYPLYGIVNKVGGQTAYFIFKKIFVIIILSKKKRKELIIC